MGLKRSYILLLFYFLLICTTRGENKANYVIWNIVEKYGCINSITLQKAIDDAIIYRNNHNTTSIELKLESGKFYLDKQIEIKGLKSDGNGWLIIKGSGNRNTELIDTEYISDTDNTFEFDNIHRVKLLDFQITGEKQTSSQGTIKDIIKIKNKVYLDIAIDKGYPCIDSLYEINTTKANKIRVFDDSGITPHFIEGPNSDHYYYRWAFEGDRNNNGKKGERPVHIDNNIWRFKLTERDLSNKTFIFKVGQRVGISSKSNRTEWARFKNGGSDLIVMNISLLRMGRCKFRGGDWTNITFNNIKILRPIINGKASFYSTDAGPQFGHDSEKYYIYNLIIENCDFRGTIDDGSAFQKVKSGYAQNNTWEDGGGVLVGENTSKNFIFRNNHFYHCPLEDMRK